MLLQKKVCTFLERTLLLVELLLESIYCEFYRYMFVDKNNRHVFDISLLTILKFNKNLRFQQQSRNDWLIKENCWKKCILTQKATRVTSHTDRIFLLSRVPLKSRAKYQFVTLLISYLSVSLSTLPEHNSYCSASVVSTRFNNFHANNWSYCPLFLIFGGSNCDGNVS